MAFEEGVEFGTKGEGDPEAAKTKKEEEYISFMEAYRMTG